MKGLSQVSNVTLIWILSLIAKLAISALLPLSHDEAYYWVWGKNLQLSYFDHPPMVGLLFWIGQLSDFFPGASRWPGVILGHLTILVWLKILSPWIPVTRLNLAQGILLLSPLLGFGSIIITPDLPVVFFWSLSTLFFIRGLRDQKLADYAFFGSSMGLGFASKYHIVLMGLALILYLIFSRRFRDLRPAGVLLSLIFFFIFSSPVFIWNFQNNFASFRFQIDHGLGGGSWQIENTVLYLLGQALLLFPPFIWLALRSSLPSPYKVLHFLCWFPLIFFVYSSFHGPVEANWPIVAYPSFYALVLSNEKILRWFKSFALVYISIGALIISQVFFPWIPNAPEKLQELHVFDQLLPYFKDEPKMYANSYQMASVIWQRTKEPTFKLHAMSRPDFFDNFPKSIPDGDFFLAKERDQALPAWLLDLAPEVQVLHKVDPKFEIVEVKMGRK